MKPTRYCKFCKIELSPRRKLTCVACKPKRIAWKNTMSRVKAKQLKVALRQPTVTKVGLLDIFRKNGMLNHDKT